VPDEKEGTVRLTVHIESGTHESGRHRHRTLAVAVAVAALVGLLTQSAGAQVLNDMEWLGRSIFFDTELSLGRNQACAACHDPAVGFTGAVAAFNLAGSVYEGSIPGRFGNRKPPASAYATLSPILFPEFDNERGEEADATFVGGNFWDGRATGEKLGNPAADQAQGPFLNPVEQALPDNACVVYRVCNPRFPADYPVSFEEVWGEQACDISWPPDVDTPCEQEDRHVDLSPSDRARDDAAYDAIALSIAAYEDSPESNPFSSKFDAWKAGLAELTKLERQGFNIFKGKAKCSRCHVLEAEPDDEPALFTDFTYDNLGVPRNPENPWYDMAEFNPAGLDWIDEGLGAFLATRMDYTRYAAENLGKQKVPTLRNLDKRPTPDFPKAFMHNGYFKTLEGVVHFYNTRDAKPVCPDPFTTEADALAAGCWPEPEVPVNVNTKELGDLKLTPTQEAALVAFLKTLSDGFTPE
jgi:cytochrome c peroxidase